MRRYIAAAVLLVWVGSPLAHAQNWVEGIDYFVVVPAQHSDAPPGKVEVAEVFSYGCPYCAKFNPLLEQLRQALSTKAIFVFIPASFNPPEDWPMFQRAACTAQALGDRCPPSRTPRDSTTASAELPWTSSLPLRSLFRWKRR
jgi:thiol:disulfide interchange protein DsbA